MPLIAKFLVKDTFHLTQRGLVILGEVIEGDITINDYISINTARFQIKGIEDVRSQDRNTIGLRMGDAVISASDLNEIKGSVLIVTTS